MESARQDFGSLSPAPGSSAAPGQHVKSTEAIQLAAANPLRRTGGHHGGRGHGSTGVAVTRQGQENLAREIRPLAPVAQRGQQSDPRVGRPSIGVSGNGLLGCNARETKDGPGTGLTETTMLTFLTSPKPFRGHIGVIQRNAIQSWKLVHPNTEVILFGEEEGTEETARECGVRYAPQVQRNALGTPYLASILDGGRDMANNALLCYINCDILLLSDFRAALERLAALDSNFLMAGQRWDTAVTEPVDFSRPDWQTGLRQRALAANGHRAPRWIDYFVFSRDLYFQKTPPLVIGRAGFDNWMIWYARSAGARVERAYQIIQL